MQQFIGNYASVNGLQLYYEVHGSGMPLVLVHGGGSTIQSNFSIILPELAKTHRVIAVEMQAHGRTADIDRPLSFAQDADDLAALLVQLEIGSADFMGFSNGGTTCLQVAIRHPELVRKLVLASVTYKRDGMMEGFWEGMQQASLDNMPADLKAAFLDVNPDPMALQAMFDRDCARMLAFTDLREEDIRSIQAPALILNGDQDVVLPAHALALSRLLAGARLAILPAGHGDYLGEVGAGKSAYAITSLVTALIIDFLNTP